MSSSNGNNGEPNKNGETGENKENNTGDNGDEQQVLDISQGVFSKFLFDIYNTINF